MSCNDACWILFILDPILYKLVFYLVLLFFALFDGFNYFSVRRQIQRVPSELSDEWLPRSKLNCVCFSLCVCLLLLYHLENSILSTLSQYIYWWILWASFSPIDVELSPLFHWPLWFWAVLFRTEIGAPWFTFGSETPAVGAFSQGLGFCPHHLMDS